MSSREPVSSRDVSVEYDQRVALAAEHRGRLRVRERRLLIQRVELQALQGERLDLLPLPAQPVRAGDFEQHPAHPGLDRRARRVDPLRERLGELRPVAGKEPAQPQRPGVTLGDEALGGRGGGERRDDQRVRDPDRVACPVDFDACVAHPVEQLPQAVAGLVGIVVRPQQARERRPRNRRGAFDGEVDEGREE